MANVLSFDVSRNDRLRVDVITPCVDGILLTNMIENFERAHGMTDPTGGYDGLIPKFFRSMLRNGYFLGQVDHYFARPPGRICVLGCECGEVGCWPLTCMVDVRDRMVTWQSFEQPYRRERDYSSFGPFIFELTQYEEAVCGLPK